MRAGPFFMEKVASYAMKSMVCWHPSIHDMVSRNSSDQKSPRRPCRKPNVCL